MPTEQAQQASGGSKADLDTLSEALFRQLVTGAGTGVSAAVAPDADGSSQRQQQQQQQASNPAESLPSAATAQGCGGSRGRSSSLIVVCCGAFLCILT